MGRLKRFSYKCVDIIWINLALWVVAIGVYWFTLWRFPWVIGIIIVGGLLFFLLRGINTIIKESVVGIKQAWADSSEEVVNEKDELLRPVE